MTIRVLNPAQYRGEAVYRMLLWENGMAPVLLLLACGLWAAIRQRRYAMLVLAAYAGLAILVISVERPRSCTRTCLWCWSPSSPRPGWGRA